MAAAVAVAVTFTAIFAQSAIPRGDYRTVEGVTAALADRGMPCRAPRLDPAPEAGVREAATCVVGGTGVRILTFASGAKRDRYVTGRRPGPAAAGTTWIVVPDDPALARTIAAAIGGRVTGAGGASR